MEKQNNKIEYTADTSFEQLDNLYLRTAIRKSVLEILNKCDVSSDVQSEFIDECRLTICDLLRTYLIMKRIDPEKFEKAILNYLPIETNS